MYKYSETSNIYFDIQSNKFLKYDWLNHKEVWQVQQVDPLLSEVQNLYREVYHGIADSIQEIEQMQKDAENFTEVELELAKEILETLLALKKNGKADKAGIKLIVSKETETELSVSEICSELVEMFGGV